MKLVDRWRSGCRSTLPGDAFAQGQSNIRRLNLRRSESRSLEHIHNQRNDFCCRILGCESGAQSFQNRNGKIIEVVLPCVGGLRCE